MSYLRESSFGENTQAIVLNQAVMTLATAIGSMEAGDTIDTNEVTQNAMWETAHALYELLRVNPQLDVLAHPAADSGVDMRRVLGVLLYSKGLEAGNPPRIDYSSVALRVIARLAQVQHKKRAELEKHLHALQKLL